MPYISTEVLVTVGLIAVLAIGSQFLPKTSQQVKTKSKKNKKKKASSDEAGVVSQAKDVQVKVEEGKPAVKSGKKGKGKKGATQSTTAAASVPASTPDPVLEAHESSESESDIEFPGLSASTQSKKARDMTLAERIKAKPKPTPIDEFVHGEVIQVRTDAAQHAGTRGQTEGSQPRRGRRICGYQA